MRHEILQTDVSAWEIGPYHAALPGPMRMHLGLDGEILVSGEVEMGYLHRGLEKTLESQSWVASVPLADHLDPEAAVFGELALCSAVEELAGIELPPRAASIRVILCELTRITSHMGYIINMARVVGAETVIHYVLRDRELILDLFELLAGSRYSLSFLRFGGVSADVTDGFIERAIDAYELIRVRLKEYNDLFTFNHVFLKRSAGVGVISPELATRVGLTGPNARASGLSLDVRKAHPYLNYGKLEFEIQSGRGEGGAVGDAYDRFLIRLREISQSLELLKQEAEALPLGPYSSVRVDQEFRVPAGEAYSRVESARGLLGCHVVSDGKAVPARVQFRTPSSACLMLIPQLVRGIRLEDLPVVLASLDLNVAEVDR